MTDEQDLWLAVIGRALAIIAMHKQELGGAEVGDKAQFLEALGLPRSEAAAMLGTSEGSIAVLLSRKKKAGDKRRGK